MESSPPTPELSFILPTDTFETIEPGLQRLRQQTIARKIEVILVAPSIRALEGAKGFASNFAALKLIDVSSVSPLGIPRAAGIRVATAPFFFVGETHSFLHADAAEKLLARARTEAWDAVTPGFVNANPTSLYSWSAFLYAYSRWSDSMPEGEIGEAPMYDTLYRREMFVAMGERLEYLLSGGDDLRRALEACRCRVYFEPTARIDHLNIAQPFAWIHEHFLIGLIIGGGRKRAWSWRRRLLYICGSSLVPFVLLRRLWHGLWITARDHRLPITILPAVLLLLFAKAAGEFLGYLGGGNVDDEKTLNRYEVRRIDYVAN